MQKLRVKERIGNSQRMRVVLSVCTSANERKTNCSIRKQKQNNKTTMGSLCILSLSRDNTEEKTKR